MKPVVLAVLVAALAATQGRAADPPAKPSPRVVDWLIEPFRQTEFGQMYFAIRHGSRMGPGDGWFKPSQSRYDWKWLASRCDRDRDGRITSSEFTGPADVFRQLDRDRDGAITPADLDWSETSAYQRQMSQIQPFFMRVDRDNNRRLSKEEWDSLFKRAAGDKGFLTPDDVRAMLFPPAPPRPAARPNDGPTPQILLKGLFNGEIGSMFVGPHLNAPAPDFALATHDGSRTIRLADYRNKKPVVLIFGSFT